MTDYEYKTRFVPDGGKSAGKNGKTHIMDPTNKWGTLCNTRSESPDGKWLDRVPGNSMCRRCTHIQNMKARQ